MVFSHVAHHASSTFVNVKECLAASWLSFLLLVLQFESSDRRLVGVMVLILRLTRLWRVLNVTLRTFQCRVFYI